LLENRETTLAALRRLLCNASTEKTKQVLQRAGIETGRKSRKLPGEDARGTAAAGHGRNGAAAYRGARKVEVRHASLTSGAQCPECQRGKVDPQRDPGLLVRIKGQAPIEATVYELEKLRCNLCGEVFTAEAPEGVGEEKYDATAAGFAAALEANRWPLALAGYDTAKPIESYLSELLLGRVMTIVLAGFAFFFAALAADAFLQLAAGGRPLRRPSMLRAAAVFLLLWGVAHVGASAGDWVGGPRLSLPLWQLPGAGAYSPAVAVLGQAFLTACAVLCALAVLVSAAARFLKPSRQYALAVLAALLYAAGRAQNAPQFLYYTLCAILASGVVIFLVRICAADLVTFGLALAWYVVAGQATTLLEQPEPVLRWNGVAAVVAAVAVGLVLVRLRPQPR
jgi:hypothetical protein